MTYDVVVVGAGVMGSAIALRLAQAGARVLVLERSVPGAEASSAAAGILGPQIEAEADGPGFRLGLASREAYPAFVAEVEELSGVRLEFRRCGLLRVGAELPRWQRAAGLAVEELPGDEARRLEPALSPAVESALHFPDEAQVDPQALARALPIAAERAGASFRQAVVAGIAHDGDRAVGVELEGGREPAGAVVVAAGAWTSLVPGVGLDPERIRPVRGQMVRLGPGTAQPGRIIFGRRGYVVPRADGTVLCGSTMERAGFEKRVTAEGVASILANALEALPGLGGREIVATWAGLRPFPQDGVPLIGELTPGLFVASGHHRNGILLTPETARLVAAAVRGDRPPELATFAPRT